MNKYLVLFFVCLIGLFLVYGSGEKISKSNLNDLNLAALRKNNENISPGSASVKIEVNFAKIPLYFIYNNGQVNKKAAFYAKASRYTLWITTEGLVFDSTYSTHSIKYKRNVSRLMFIGANKNPEIIPVQQTKLKVNYFKGNDRSKWYCDVPTSQAVLYKGLYENIDLKVYGIEKQVEYDWIVKPGGNPEDIRFQYKNVKGTRLDGEGNLLIETDSGELVHKKSVSYQFIDKRRLEVKALFKKIGKNTYGFEISEYDKSCELIIDPVVLAYSTYLGGDDSDGGNGIAVDSSGYVYITGRTASTDFPTLNQYQSDQPDKDAFVAKIDATGVGASSLIFCTYLGGEGADEGKGLSVDNSGNVYVTGDTESPDFPTLNQYQTDQPDKDAFVTIIDTNQSGASSLIYSTYLGGESFEYGEGIAVGINGYVYVAGWTASTDFPIQNQYQTFQGNYYNAFVTKIDINQTGGASIIYSTYLGGGGEYCYGIAVDSSENAYVVGYTDSPGFPIRNQYQSDQPGWDSFLAKLDTTQSGDSSLIYSTYLGGEADDFCWGIAADSSGNAYVCGATYSTDFPILNQYQADPGDNDADAYVTKIDTTQSGVASLIYSTYLGGVSLDYSRAIAVHSSGNVFVTGETLSTDFPILDQYQTYQGSYDAFVTQLDTTQNGTASLIYSTYLGGVNSDRGYGIAVGGSRNVYVTGSTSSTDFPIQNQYQTHQEINDAFVTKLNAFPPPSITVTSPNGGEEWQSGSHQTITWTSEWEEGNVNIDYSPDNGDNWTSIAISTPNDGSRFWTVPDTVSNQCLVRVSETDGSPVDTSDEVFSIIPAPTITVTSPNGGEEWLAGTSHTITWTCEGSVENVMIQCSFDGGTAWKTIAVSTENDGQFVWIIPNRPSDECLIRVSATDVDEVSTDVSDGVFSIVSPVSVSIIVRSPNGGESWAAGSSQEIKWNSTGDINQVNVKYSTDNGITWKSIVQKTDNDGSYNWVIPDTVSAKCLVQVAGNDSDLDPKPSDVSDEVFSIVSTTTAAIIVNSPNGGESWVAGSSQVIKWTSTGDINNVTIKYSTDNGTSWKTIAQTTANNGSFNWNVPSTASDKCLVQVIGNDNDLDPKPSDVSDEVFSIVRPSSPAIWIITPNGGEQLMVGSRFPITWYATNSREEAKIEYSVNGGQTWMEITGAEENDGEYDWIVPDTLSETCLIRVSEIDGQPEDVSDAVFSIVSSLPNGITVISPNGGESWVAGSSQEIKWTSSSDINNVTIKYSNDNGFTWQVIAHAAATDGSYDWTVPDTVSDKCIVQVIGDDNDLDPKPSDVSDEVFSIVRPSSPTIRIISPNGGEQLMIGSRFPITWYATNSREEAKIEYSVNGGETWMEITGATENDGEYDWIVPDTPSEICLVRISETDGQPVDVSDAVFSIVSPAPGVINVTYPNGGENWTVDSSQEIKWTCTGDINNVTIEYSTDNGTTWKTIIQTTPNDGSYNWAVPDTVSDECLVRVTDNDNDMDPKPCDVSDQVFSIVSLSPGAFRVTSPNGGEDWEVGSIQSITWDRTGDINGVMIEYSFDSGSTWKNIVSSTNNSGSYNWLLPDTVSDECLVRITANDGGGDPKPSDVSNEVFSIVRPSEPTITVTAPNGGEQLVVGSWVTIEWYATDSREEAKIEYSVNGGETWMEITGATENDGEYDWIVADEPSEICLVRISETDGQAVDVSDAVFSIVSPTSGIITVISPNGGESWITDSSQEIKWTCSGDINNVTIEYSTDNGTTWKVIVQTTPNNGSYDWAVPDTVSDECLVRVTASDNDLDPKPWDVSDEVFSIVSSSPGAFRVTSPNGGEAWEVDSIQTITWDRAGDIGSVNIDYSPDNGNTWSTIVSSANNSGSYNWLVPNTVSDECLVRITGNDGVGDPKPSDVSDEVFSIVRPSEPTIKVISPNGGEELPVGSRFNITWYATDSREDVTIAYSSNGGETWTGIIASTPNSGSFDWIIPDDPSDNCLVRISEIDGEPVDVSDAVFSIVSTSGDIKVNSPNGGENLEAGTEYTITWASSGVDNVVIKYSIDNGVTWTTIGTAPAAEGIYTWLVPETPSETCLVQVTAIDTVLDPRPSDMSDQVFSIVLPYTGAIRVDSPNGGETFSAGSQYDITWTSTGVNNVIIEYSIDNGSEWISIDTVAAGDGRYTWTVPQISSQTCLVRISGNTPGAPPFDVSDSVFSII
jgi:hypothetical protein